MLYDRDRQIIDRLKEHDRGKYLRFSTGDIEYIIYTIKRCARIEGGGE